MAQLARDNILKIKPYVGGRPIVEVQKQYGLTEVIKLASNENPLGSSPKAMNAARKALNEVNLYPLGDCPVLRDAIARKYKLKQENVIAGNGSNEVLELIGTAFLNPGDEVLISENTFIVYKLVAQRMDVSLKEVPMKDFRYDMDGFASALTEKTKVVYLANPNNPTGTIITKQEMDVFLAKVSRSTIVVMDEAYGEYVQSEQFPQSLNYITEGKNVFVLKTFSKAFGLAGLRLGFGLARPDLVDAADRARQPFNVNSVAQAAGVAALKDDKFVAESIKVTNEGKLFLYSLFDELGLAYVKSEANFVFVDFKQDVKPVFEELMKKGIIIRTFEPTFFRVTVGTSEQNRKFAGALREVLKR